MCQVPISSDCNTDTESFMVASHEYIYLLVSKVLGCAKTWVLKFSTRCPNGAKYELMRANQGLMDSND